MYPAPFDYVRPASLEEALAALAERGEEGKVLAGGQSLLPLLKLRFASPATLIDVNRVPGLDSIERDDGILRVGALVRHNQVVASGLVKRTNHTMAAAAPWIADPLVRNLGTVGGSLAHADPQGDWASVMLACGAEVLAASRSGRRTIPMDEFVTGPFQSALRPDELLVEVRVPIASGPTGGDYQKLERKVGDYATVGVATHLELDRAGRVAAAGIALTSVAPANVKCTEAERALVGAEPGDDAFAEAADLAAAAADPRTDVRGSAEYKRHVVRVFVRRGLARALERARAGAGQA